MKDILRTDGLVKRFGDLTAVDGVGFSIAEGETFGLSSLRGRLMGTSPSRWTGRGRSLRAFPRSTWR